MFLNLIVWKRHNKVHGPWSMGKNICSLEILTVDTPLTDSSPTFFPPLKPFQAYGLLFPPCMLISKALLTDCYLYSIKQSK